MIWKLNILIGLIALISTDSVAQDAGRYIESDVISLSDKKGLSFETKAGDITLKPFVLVQSSAKFNYYDDEGLDLADQDNVANSGFEIGNALMGFAGQALKRVTFNLTLNAAQSGDALLQQAWVELNLKDWLRFRAGKFKTPFAQAYLATLGETLFPVPPLSLTAAVNIPYSVNSVNPAIATGFDVGVQMHGLINQKYEYRIGIFNGTGSAVNAARKTLSDDLGIPSMLYAARFAWMPHGNVATHQGSPSDLHSDKWLAALSASVNVEANWQASNDFRAGLELSRLINRLYLCSEVYYMSMEFVKRQKIATVYNFVGGYIQGGYFVTDRLQPVLRYDILDRNSTSVDGCLNAFSAGINWFISGNNLKLQAMYQYLGKFGHTAQIDRDNDDLGLARHAAQLMMQISF